MPGATTARFVFCWIAISSNEFLIPQTVPKRPIKGAVDPTTGLLGIKAFAAAVIGGFGSLPGALAGGLIVGVIEPFASRYIAAGYSQVAPYALLLAVLIFRPNGLFSQVRVKKV